MFELLRSWIKPVIYITLAFFVALIVLKWGADLDRSSRYDPNSGIIGMVNGEEVSNDSYQRTYQNLYNQQFQGRDVTPTDAELERIRTQAWNSVVSDMALQQEIAKRGIKISDQDLYYYIRYNPPKMVQDMTQFQTDGKFDYQRYLNIMADPKNAPFWAALEQSITPQVQVAKMQEVITTAARVSAHEIRDAYLQTAEKASFAFAIRPLSSLAGDSVNVTEGEMRDYLAKNEYRFQRDDMRGIRLALFSKDVTEDDWLRVGAEMKKLADSIQIDTSVAFADWAKAYSEDASASDGGQIGFYAITDLDSAYVKGALALPVGGISGPVRSSFGWHIIKLEGMKDADGKETTDPAKAAEINTAHILFRVEASEETREAAQRRASEFYHQALASGFENAATALGVELKTPAPFQKGASIQFLGTDYFASEWAFNSEQGDISGIYDNASNYFVMELTDIIPKGTMSFEDLRSTLQNQVRNEKLKQMSLDTMNAVYAEIQAGTDMETAATNHGATYVTTPAPISRNTPLPQPIGRDPIATGLSFSLDQPDQMSEPTVSERGALIVKLLEKQSPGLEDFNQVRDSVAANLLNMKQRSLWQNWYSNLLKNVKSENYLERETAESRTRLDSSAVATY